MSYRDLRNFSECMRSLGFPHPISLESFRTPNFALTEACLRWLAERLEPGAALAGGGEALEARVQLVTHAVTFFLSRANIKLNGRKLYGADGWAARELLKVATFLRSALDTPLDDQAQGRDVGTLNYDVSSRLGEIKQARHLATEITAQGAFLYDLLAKEPEHKEAREQALSRPLDMARMETALRRALAALTSQLTSRREQIDSVSASEAALDSKLERRRAELERAQKRLRTVHHIKPAYQGELTSLEAEIEGLWDQYVLRYRCVEALKHQLSLLENAQSEAAEEQQAAIMQLIHKYEAEDVLGKLSDSDEEDSSDEQKDLSEVKQPRPATRPKTRLRIKTAGTAAESRRAFGNMAAGARDSLDDIRDEEDSTRTAAESRRAFGNMAAGTRDSLDDIRDEDDSTSESELSVRPAYGREETSSRWSRAARPRPGTRTLAADDEFADLVEGVETGDGGDSLGSSSESELRLVSAPQRQSAAPGRASVLSDNEF